MSFTDGHEGPGASPRRAVTATDLQDYVESFPALLWRVEIARARIEFLNRHVIGGLGGNTRLFMKSEEARQGVVLAEDAYLLDSFMEAMKRGEAAEVIVRARPDGPQVRWLKLAVWAHPGDLRYCMGYLMDVSDRAEAIRSTLERQTELECMTQFSDAPALLIDARTKKLLARNEAAGALFLRSPEQFKGLRFADLHHHSMTTMIHKICEELVFSKRWSGRALFVRSDSSVFTAEAAIRFFLHQGTPVLRVFLTGVEDAPGEDVLAPCADNEDAAAGLLRLERSLAQRAQGISDVRELLALLLEAQLPGFGFDSILFSDIHARKNRVHVYWAGQPFAGTPQGAAHPYEGTIAQVIDRFQLDHLIVEDTLESIKAIDWALFIPKGVRSYFAKPFYSRGVLRSVMILCSLRPGAFPGSGLSEYAALFEAFRRGVDNWRAAPRRKAPGRPGSAAAPSLG